MEVRTPKHSFSSKALLLSFCASFFRDDEFDDEDKEGDEDDEDEGDSARDINITV